MEILEKLSKESELKLKLIEDITNKDVFVLIDRNEDELIYKLMVLINENYEDLIVNYISDKKDSNKLSSAIYDFNSQENEDKIKLKATTIIYFNMTYRKILSKSCTRRVSITSNKKIDLFIYKEDFEALFPEKKDIIFGDDEKLQLDNFAYNYFKDLLENKQQEKLLSLKKDLNILLKGVPGTGKSWTIDEHIKRMGIKENTLRINIHSASSNADLMQGIGVNLINNTTINYIEKTGLILNHIYKAICDPDHKYALILEEIQENSLNELIGDLIYLIENEKRISSKYIKAIMDDNGYKSKELLLNEGKSDSKTIEDLIEEIVKNNGEYDTESFQRMIHYVQMPQLVESKPNLKMMIIPDNLYIFCTTNYREDKKIIEDNLFRRFEVIDIFPDPSIVGNDVIEKFLKQLNNNIVEKMREVDNVHTDRYLIGHANWMKINDEKDFYRAFIKLINEFKEIREVEFVIFKDIIKGINMKTSDKITNENQKNLQQDTENEQDRNEGSSDDEKTPELKVAVDEVERISEEEFLNDTISIAIDKIKDEVKESNNYYDLIKKLIGKANYPMVN